MWTYFSFEGGGICEVYCCIVVSLEIDFLRQILFFLEVIYAKVERC